MTREQKIEVLAEKEYWGYSNAEEHKKIFKAGILAGIALRDAELLEAVNTFDYRDIDRKIKEQFIKILKK